MHLNSVHISMLSHNFLKFISLANQQNASKFGNITYTRNRPFQLATHVYPRAITLFVIAVNNKYLIWLNNMTFRFVLFERLI